MARPRIIRVERHTNSWFDHRTKFRIVEFHPEGRNWHRVMLACWEAPTLREAIEEWRKNPIALR